MSDFKIKVACEVPFVNLDGTCNIKIGNKYCKIDLKDNMNIEELIEDSLIEIAKNTFADTDNGSFDRLLEIGLNLDYKKEDFIRMIIHSIKQNKVLMCNYRGIGKSHFLNEVAKCFGLPIVAKYKSNLSYDKNIDIYRVKDIVDGIDFRTLLVDDLALAEVQELRDKGFRVVGFVRNELFY